MASASADGYNTTDGDVEGHDSGVEDVETGPSYTGQQETHSDGSAADTEGDSQEARRTSRRLERLEKAALAVMSKDYVRHTGNVHFKSAMDSAGHWDDWEVKHDMERSYWQQADICVDGATYFEMAYNAY